MRARVRATDLGARGEPMLWLFGGTLALGIAMIVGFLLLVLWNGLTTFYPKPIALVTLKNGAVLAGEPARTERYRLGAEQLAALADADRRNVAANDGFAARTLYRVGNYDFYNEDFRWVSEFDVAKIEWPSGFFFVERLEWGPLIGKIKSVDLAGETLVGERIDMARLTAAHGTARARWERVREIDHNEIGATNYYLNQERLKLRRVSLRDGEASAAYAAAKAAHDRRTEQLKAEYETLAAEAQAIKAEDAKDRITMLEASGEERTFRLSEFVRFHPANDLTLAGKLAVYLSRWWEFLTGSPREANTEGGVWPAIFGTFAMTLLMVVVVAPFGVVTALYLREYARQGRLVSIVRISVNNLAGVPSIVYGVFGLGFFAYIVGGTIDELFHPERLPNPTFGTGGLLWASLTLAILTVPVVIVATEEALSAVPRSMREGSLACGASKWQTIRRIVLPRAMPGIMTGLILAMARGAGEVAPLMLVGVVKLAPELPIDRFFPYLHLERSFMHLGFHIFDVGFQSRNSEAGKPMVFVTTLLLIALIALMNASAIVIRNRLKRNFVGSQF
ncbi:MAG TPA: phosphate ABC transporter permease PstA [Alphaproteobacteria bacterium]|nr:phosphate ABC transporter permease PstA [Alphaproteobacteria bacterium]